MIITKLTIRFMSNKFIEEVEELKVLDDGSALIKCEMKNGYFHGVPRNSLNKIVTAHGGSKVYLTDTENIDEYRKQLKQTVFEKIKREYEKAKSKFDAIKKAM